MVFKLRRVVGKKVLFFFGILLTGVLGLVSNMIRTNYSKSNSLTVPKARADVPPMPGGWCGQQYTDAQCDCYWSCFPADTPISTPSGARAIQALGVGDLVYGFDIETGQIGTYPVTQTFRHDRNDPKNVYSPLIKITHKQGSLLVTDNHLIYRKNKRVGEFANFERAGMLEAGDRLTLESGEESAITAIEKGPDYDFVYNLEVEGVHTYFACGVRVHNSAGGDSGGGPGGCCGSSSSKYCP